MGNNTANKLLLIGSDVKIINLPIKEVNLLEEGSLPAYGYNPGDFIELLAGKVTIEGGRLDRGDYFIMVAFGSGLAWASALFRY